MLRMVATVFTVASVLWISSVAAQEYSVETIDTAPEADLAEDLLGQFGSTGYRIKRGGTRTEAEVWLCKEWKIDGEFKPTLERHYPFTPGQLIGLLHIGRRGSDFRDQSINRGWYTLRFGLQPVDGNHVGTSPTRDFLVMVAAEDDEVGKEWDLDELNEASAEVAGSSHPAMLCLQPPQEGEVAVRHNDVSDWWILHVVGKGVADGKSQNVSVDMVVSGHAAE